MILLKFYKLINIKELRLFFKLQLKIILILLQDFYTLYMIDDKTLLLPVL